jgi:hypothetical protein
MTMVALTSSSLVAAESEPTLVDQLIQANRRIRSLQCDIRREVESGEKIVTTLSRLSFRRGDRLRVETVTPAPRRIAVDGIAIHKWIRGHQKGVRIPLKDAPAPELLQVRRVPASGEEYLLRLKDASETVLAPTTEFPTRRGYAPSTPHPYVILSLDDNGRLARIEFLDPDNHSKRLSRIDFGGWKEAAPSIWIACTQLTETQARNGISTHETLRVSRLKVNQEIPDQTFDPAHWASDVEFVAPTEMLKHLSGLRSAESSKQ